MNELVNNIRDFIHECFDTLNLIPSDDMIYERFPEASIHIVEQQINSFFDGHYILSTTVIKYEGKIYPQVQIELEDAI